MRQGREELTMDSQPSAVRTSYPSRTVPPPYRRGSRRSSVPLLRLLREASHLKTSPAQQAQEQVKYRESGRSTRGTEEQPHCCGNDNTMGNTTAVVEAQRLTVTGQDTTLAVSLQPRHTSLLAPPTTNKAAHVAMQQKGEDDEDNEVVRMTATMDIQGVLHSVAHLMPLCPTHTIPNAMRQSDTLVTTSVNSKVVKDHKVTERLHSPVRTTTPSPLITLLPLGNEATNNDNTTPQCDALIARSVPSRHHHATTRDARLLRSCALPRRVERSPTRPTLSATELLLQAATHVPSTARCDTAKKDIHVRNGTQGTSPGKTARPQPSLTCQNASHSQANTPLSSCCSLATSVSAHSTTNNNKPTTEMYKWANVTESADGLTYLNDYAIVGDIGRGASATVKLAHSFSRYRNVAIKVITKRQPQNRHRQLLHSSSASSDTGSNMSCSRESTLNSTTNSSNNRVSSEHEIRNEHNATLPSPRALRKMLTSPTLPQPHPDTTTMTTSLKSEITIMTRLHHRNIVPLYEVIDDPQSNKLYLVMKYIEKGAIATVHEDGTLSARYTEAQLTHIAAQVCDGLVYLHRHGIVHRDIKPENILLSARGRAYLSDFGVAELLHHPATQTNTTTHVNSDETTALQALDVCKYQGTPLFIGPELYIRRDDLEQAVVVVKNFQINLFALDIWALGITFLALLTGRVPFTSLAQVRACALDKDKVNILLPPTLSPEWAAVLRAMLAPDPRCRPGARTIRDAFYRILRKSKSAVPSAVVKEATSGVNNPAPPVNAINSTTAVGPVKAAQEEVAVVPPVLVSPHNNNNILTFSCAVHPPQTERPPPQPRRFLRASLPPTSPFSATRPQQQIMTSSSRRRWQRVRAASSAEVQSGGCPMPRRYTPVSLLRSLGLYESPRRPWCTPVASTNTTHPCAMLHKATVSATAQRYNMRNTSGSNTTSSEVTYPMSRRRAKTSRSSLLLLPSLLPRSTATVSAKEPLLLPSSATFCSSQSDMKEGSSTPEPSWTQRSRRQADTVTHLHDALRVPIV